MNKEEATICLQQLTTRPNPLGVLKAMLGATNFSIGPNGVSFCFKMFRKANICRIELDRGADLYNLVFLKLDKTVWEIKEVIRINGLYCDALKESFERTTGLRVCL